MPLLKNYPASRYLSDLSTNITSPAVQVSQRETTPTTGRVVPVPGTGPGVRPTGASFSPSSTAVASYRMRPHRERVRAARACGGTAGGAHAAYGRAAPPPVARPRGREPGDLTKLYETRAPKPAVIPAGASRGEVRYQLLYCHSCLSRFRFTGTLCLVAVPAPERPFYHGKLDGVGDLA